MKFSGCLLVLGLTGLAACGGSALDVGEPAEEPSISRAAVRPAPADGIHNEARAMGVLRADPITGCLWVEASDGAGELQLLLQGESYSVDFASSPAVVMDGDTMVARVGDFIEVGGGNSDDGVEGCPAGPQHVFLGSFFERPS